MQYVSAKLVRDDIGSHRRFRTLYKVDPDKCDMDILMAIAARQLPADTTELEVIVNAPTYYVYPIIRLCQLRQISLTLIHNASKDWSKTERFDVLRYWTCSGCNSRYSESHHTCPYCGGYGYYLAMPIPNDPIAEIIEAESEHDLNNRDKQIQTGV